MAKEDVEILFKGTGFANKFYSEQFCVLVEDFNRSIHNEYDRNQLLPLKHVGNLGQGAWGVVDVAINVYTNQRVAVKTVRAHTKRQAKDLRQIFDQEVLSLQKLTVHQHIVKYIASYTKGMELALLLLPVADTNLRDFLLELSGTENLDQTNQDVLYRSFGCLSTALAFIHDHKIRHKDVKPGNILIHKGEVLFTDFGLAFDFSKSSSSTSMGEPRARTPRYAAPEVERWDLRGWRSDVYSLGCVFLEICTALAGKSGEDIAEYLGTDEEDLIFQEHHEKALEWTQTLSGVHGRESNDLLALPIRWTSRMLQYRPSHRPYMTDVLDMMGKDTRPMKHRRSIFFCSICQAELKTRNDITAEGTDLDDDSRSDLGDDHDDESDDHLDLDRTGELSTQLVAEDAPEEQDITDAALHISELSKSLPPSVSFTIQRLASCIQLYQSILNATGGLQSLGLSRLMCLQLELVQLLNWSTQLGFDNPDRQASLFLKADQAVILNVLTQKQIALVHFFDTHLEQTSGNDLQPPSSLPLARKGLERSWRKNFPDHTLVKILINAQDSNSTTVPSVKWRDSSASNASGLKKLLETLAEFNNELYLLLEQPMKVQTQEFHHKIMMRTLIMYFTPSDLAILVQALREFSTSHPSILSDTKNEASVDFASIAEFKLLNEALDSEWDLSGKELQNFGIGLPQGLSRKRPIDRTSISISPQDEDNPLSVVRSDATYLQENQTPKSVLVEWKEYDYQMPGSPSPPPLIVNRVQKLATLLGAPNKPKAFRILHCLGYFDNLQRSSHNLEEDSDLEDDDLDARIGFVYEKPPSSTPESSLVCLFDLLSSAPKPPLTDCIALAKSLANSLFYLHSVNWLHKGLRSQNILLLGAGIRGITYSQPYLTGFDFARPARRDEMTEVPEDNFQYNMYRHPSTQGHGFGPRESFRKSFDIYSLGVIMVEIMAWTTIDKYLGIRSESARMRQTTKIREMLLDDRRLQSIGATAGNKVVEVIRVCLEGGEALGIGISDNETSNEVAARMQDMYYEKVILGLESIRV